MNTINYIVAAVIGLVVWLFTPAGPWWAVIIGLFYVIVMLEAVLQETKRELDVLNNHLASKN